MIKNKNTEMLEEIRELLLQYYPMKDSELINYLLDNEYDDHMGLVEEQDGKVVACCFNNEHQILMNKRLLSVGFLIGYAIHPDYRQGKYGENLIKQFIEMSSKKYLVSMINTYNPKEFKKFGFEIIGYRKKYHIGEDEILMTNTSNVSTQYDISQLAYCYQQFSNCFGCYSKKDVTDFKNYEKLINSCGGKIAVCKNKDEKVSGYCVYYDRGTYIEVSELVYLDSLSLSKLLRYVIQNKEYVEIEVSSHERLEKIFPNAIARKTTYTLGRINSLSLFNKLYNINATNIKEAFKKMNVILNISEKF